MHKAGGGPCGYLPEVLFYDLADARAKIKAWRTDYNLHSPLRSLGQRTPAEYISEFENRLTEQLEAVRL